jgi:uncharacterized protein CbrC (UPF0167 family)
VSSQPLPNFPYYPGAVEAGRFSVSDVACAACGQRRGWVYTGSVYSVERDLEDRICPWCIADGSAAERFDAVFTDRFGAPENVPPTVVEHVTRQTPGFAGWQQERWLYHCGDGCAFLGPVGYADIQDLPVL